MAFAALKHAKPRLTVNLEFIHLDSKARLGGILVKKPMDTGKQIRLSSSSSSSNVLNSPTAIISKLLDQVRLSRSSSLTKHQ
ncbi:mitochondrial ribosomal large subunit component [Puccinia graminis f. sp. tritici]|uniref:Mitochondrial ribosomal large subunit component n=1 Tax=Puccinia graminis f. sp. tritici TaxID=56615 RepID=A0A5B0M062_PUCGR|nr:mitochondrial ribosomal large subunit component [Puccinia graminis f. sp. tritici]KAA1090210.1 mitochondrial ribosomal large subunit component [Puccinia graminis f. sp. tritici]